jgi:hypothetical protein
MAEKPDPAITSVFRREDGMGFVEANGLDLYFETGG